MATVYYVSSDSLYHHGVANQKWGVRKYQYADGSLTPEGYIHYGYGKGKSYKTKLSIAKDHKKSVSDTSSKGITTTISKNISRTNSTMQKSKAISEQYVKDFIANKKTQITGRQYVDTYLDKGTTFSRIQTSDNFENFTFYATYTKADSDKYMGLFGKNLKSRAEYAAKKAEKEAKKTGSEEDIQNAKELREKSDNMKIYQVKIDTSKKLKIPSDTNAADITCNLLKEDEFKKNYIASITDSKEKMKRPTQQILFDQALNAVKKDSSRLTDSDKVAIYKAFNLSLTNHNEQEVAAQDRFYSEMKKKGYSALLDYNDKDYSSYHAKRPMIVFDLDAVKVQSVTETDSKTVDKLYTKYNNERIVKELAANTVGLLSKYSTKTVSECQSYVNYKVNEYLE